MSAVTVILRAGPAGDIEAPSDGLFLDDTRHLSRWVLTLSGVRPVVLSAEVTDPAAPTRRAVLVPATPRGTDPPYVVFRTVAADRAGLVEELRLVSHSASACSVSVAYEVAADFADQFELRSDRHYAKPGAVRGALSYERGGFARRTVLSPDRPEWTVSLPPGGEVTLRAAVGAVAAPVRDAGAVAAYVEADLAAFVDRAEPPASGWPELDRSVRQGLHDVGLLRIPAPGDPGRTVVAAGSPWYMTLFGRDSILTAYFLLPYAPELARDTLHALAATQGRTVDPDRVEEPGKIIHETRVGELASLGDVPYGRYYATVDATPLFLVLLSEYVRTTGDPLADLEPAARAAAGWILDQLAPTGFLTYPTDRPGLRNHCWKDSAESICHPDGTVADGPVAVCEAQGYAVDALSRMAALARDFWGDPGYAATLADRAATLRADLLAAFVRDGSVALALDGAGRPLWTVTSNPAHLLWSGVLDPAEGAAVGRRLLSPDLSSGWGLRTLAAGQAPYHPLSYHNGGVWPHDTAIAIAGLARYGLHDEAHRLATGLLAAASARPAGGPPGRLPELIAGYGRDEHPAPVPYRHACSPQAWSAAAPLLIRTALH